MHMATGPQELARLRERLCRSRDAAAAEEVRQALAEATRESEVPLEPMLPLEAFVRLEPPTAEVVRQVYGLQVRMLASIADAHTEAVYTLASFTNGQDAWSDAATATVARGALAGLGGQDTCHRLLAQYVKPVCIDSRALGHKVTSEGRRDYYSNRRPNYHYQSGYNELDDATPLQKRPEISTVMSYCITTLQARLVEEFPLIVPSLLALLEDLSFSVRERGQAVLADFLAACPHDTIVRAGLLDLFRDVCALGMTYYPPLVSIDESERLITISFSNAITLCEIEAAESHTDRVKLLLPILRDGLLSGYALNSDRPQLIVVLNLCVSRIVDLVGLPVTRYLKTMLGNISNTLTNPFAHLSPSLLDSTLDLLIQLMRVCRPRIRSHWVVIWEAVTICWMNIAQEEGRQAQKDKLSLAVAILREEAGDELERDDIRRICTSLPPGLY